MYLCISPKEWELPKADEANSKKISKILGINIDEIEKRCKNAVYGFLDKLYDENEKALHHYYRADRKYISEMDSGNYLMALNYLTMYDRYNDEIMLEKAENCFLWAYRNTTEIHPMFTWQGGVRDGFKPHELYVKYTGDAYITCLGLYQRTKNEEYLFYAKQFHNFMKQAQKAGYKYKFDTNTYSWLEKGFCWWSFGYPVISYLEHFSITKDEDYLKRAIEWGEHGLSLQSDDGSFYLIDGEFWNSDLTAMELRALVFLYEVTKSEKFLNSAKRFAQWLVKNQREDGCWPIGIDREGEICAPNVGPGDTPNIGISFLRLYHVTNNTEYLNTAVKTVSYSLQMQAIKDGRYPYYLDDPHVKWGFWSWEPLYDYSLSGDQSVHHIRGMLFLLDYLSNSL
jgi:hypothetical protein